MRVIIRFSLKGDRGSVLRNKLKPILLGYGFIWKRDVLATYEHTSITEIGLALAMAEFWEKVHKSLKTRRLNHFWMYTDNPLGTSRRKRKK